MTTMNGQATPATDEMCFPVCPKCERGEQTCILINKPNPSKKTKFKWSPDIVRLKCGTEVVMPITHLSYKNKYFCDVHGKYEAPIPKPKAKHTYPAEPLF